MAYLGIDLGTTGCKAVIFDEEGKALSSAYREYQIISEKPGYAEIDPVRVWSHVRAIIAECISKTGAAVDAVSVSSFGEAIVPVSAGRQPLGNSLLNYDSRGVEFIPRIREIISDEELYQVNGNALGPNYGITRLLWYLNSRKDVYDKVDKFLLWGSYILYMMGAEPMVDYALANRTLLLDIEKKQWNLPLMEKLGLDPGKFPALSEAGEPCGRMSAALSAELGFDEPPLLVVGTHDQCSNAAGCGVLNRGEAMYGMGTFHCIVSTFTERVQPEEMLRRGLNTEHHAMPGRWVSFIYNQGGILLKWFRDTFAAEIAAENDVFSRLLDEMPSGPSPVSVLPHFMTTGTPDFIEKTSGLISGLTVGTTRGEICKGILEGVAFYLKQSLDLLSPEMAIDKFTVVGGGSRSDVWMQLTADILQRPCSRTEESEAGSIGAAALAACGAGRFGGLDDAIAAMVKPGRLFEPKVGPDFYLENYERYVRIFPLFGDFLAGYKE